MSERKKIIISVAITFVVTSLFFHFISPVITYLSGSKSEKVEKIIESRYINEVDKEKIEEFKAKGVAAALGDEHSYYLTSEEYSALMSDITGEYKGIGVEIFSNADGYLTVSNVFIDTPAYNAGIKTGDTIIKVDNIDISFETSADAISYMRGLSEEGKKVETMTVTLLRGGESFTAELTRSEIKTQTVFAKDIENIKYIRITSFSTGTSMEFKNVIESIDGTKGIIIDVRDNPGGLLNEVCDVCDMLLPSGNIVYTEDKNGKRVVHNSDAEHLDVPLVVLINENSASASEILAGSIKDLKAGTLVGTTSYGKGSVQEIFPFEDKSALKLTIAYYYTPSGVCINGIGITPDVEVKIPEENLTAPLSALPLEKDTQLSRAIKILSER